MGPNKREAPSDARGNYWFPRHRPTPVPYDGPASRLRSSMSNRSREESEPVTGPKATQSNPTQEPAKKQNFEVVIWTRPRVQIPIEIKREKRNTFSEEIINRWPVAEAREAIEREIALHTRGLHTKDDSSTWEKEVVSKMKWANRLLREGYWAFVQKVPACLPASPADRSQSYREEKSANSGHRGFVCAFPNCGKFFQDGQYRISFEPPSRSGTSADSKPIIDLTHGNNRGEEVNISDPDDLEKYTFCLECFDKLLMPYTQGRGDPQPTDPFSQKPVTNKMFNPPKSGYLRPSPSCRIYDRIQPEARSGSNKSFNLSSTEQEAVMTWRAYNYNQGLSMMSRRNGFMFRRGLDFYQEGCKMKGLNGVGIAEFVAVSFPRSPAFSNSRRRSASDRFSRR